MTSVDPMTVELSLIACCGPLAGPSLSDEEAESTATLFKALGDPARVRIVNLLAARGGSVCACEFEPSLGLSQPTVSHVRISACSVVVLRLRVAPVDKGTVKGVRLRQRVQA